MRGNPGKTKNFTPAFIMVLHTFGRDLKWNPHIHCLISEGGYSDDGHWRHVKHFNYTYLRNAFRTALLNYARHREIDKKLFRAISKQKHSFYMSYHKWRPAIAAAFGYDPLQCECGTTMKLLDLYYRHKLVSLEEMYEKVMSRSRGKRSPG